MRYLTIMGLVFVFTGSALAASRDGSPAYSSGVNAAKFPTSKARLSTTPAKAATPTQEAAVAVTAQTVAAAPTAQVNDRADERKACESGNGGGAGNVFVWADKNSIGTEYAGMIESKNPEDNACFVRVDITSTDPKVDLSNIKSKYFRMGSNIKCGSWVNEDQVKERILAASKSTRTWATVGGVVAGVGVGVGAMELFGNQAIGGAVEGQKNKKLSPAEVLWSQLTPQERIDYATKLKAMDAACDAAKNDNLDDVTKKKCDQAKQMLVKFKDALTAPATTTTAAKAN